MKETKNVMDTVIDSSSKTVNNWVETAQKAQKAALSGNSIEKNAELYKEWLNNQMSIFRNITVGNDTDKSAAKSSKESNNTNNAAENTAENFFKSWYNNQMNAVKQMTDLNQNIFNSMSNFGKPAEEVSNNFSSANKAWTGMYDQWMGTINNTYHNLNNAMKGGINKDTFANMFQANNVMMKMQEFYAPIMKGMQSGQFNLDSIKKMMDPAQYKSLLENMFGSTFFPKNNMNDMFESYTKNVQNWFSTNQNMTKDVNEAFQNMMKQYPQLFTGDAGKMINMYNNMSDTFNKSVAPFVKMMTPGKEKERMEAAMETMDKIAIYNIKNSQLQYLIYTTGYKAMEKSIENVAEKFKANAEVTNFQQFFQEWVNDNEADFVSLFNHDDFSALKAEVTSLSLAIKKDMENQFEQQLANYPFVFKSEMNELYQTIHDLKNKVKALESKLAIHNAASVELDEEETVKPVAKSTSRKK